LFAYIPTNFSMKLHTTCFDTIVVSFTPFSCKQNSRL
jgi:hypothetical protein